MLKGDSEVAAAVKEWLQHEEKVYEGALLAEIVHLPQGRTGNIVCRPVLRHRLLVKPEADLEGITPDRVVSEVLAGVEVPK